MKKSVLLINLGSPKSLKLKDVKIYLNEFLSDDLVIDLPKIVQQLILKLFILPFRPLKTKSAYETIWGENGSPLICNTEKIANALNEKMDWNIDYAMRYQEPSIKKIIKKYKKNNIKELIILPLYPHNAISTTLSTELFVKKVVKEIFPELNLFFIKPFYNNELYIKALSESIKPYLNKIDKLIFSYHGIPERHLRKGDNSGLHCLNTNNCCDIECNASRNCYKSNVLMTSKLCADYLQLENSKWMIAFQSRVSIIDPNWLKPYTDLELKNLPKNGVKNIGIICPSFVADCLETLEEINIRGREQFLDSGGISFTYIPCLNNDKIFILSLMQLIEDVKFKF